MKIKNMIKDHPVKFNCKIHKTKFIKYKRF